MNNLREEFFELIKESKTRWLGGGGLAISGILAFFTGIQGKPYILKVTVYTLIVTYIFVVSFYVLIARKKTPSVFRISNPSESEKEIPKYQSLRPFGIGGIVLSIALAGLFVLVPPVNEPVRYVINGTPTPTPTQTLPPPTATATHRASDYIYYAFILDASESMNETFDGQNKWSTAINAAVSIIDGSNRDAHFALYTVGGSGPNQASDPCLNPSGVEVPSGGWGEVYTRLAQLQPGGGGSFKAAFNLAKTDLQSLPLEAIRSITFITGIEDSCQGRDALKDLKYAIQDIDTIDIRGEIVLLDDDGARTQEIMDYLNSLSENVNVQAPQTIQVLYNITVQNIVVNINKFISIELPKRAPESPIMTDPPINNTEVSTPVLSQPDTQSSSTPTSPPAPVPTKTATAIPTKTDTPIPTSTPTPPPPTAAPVVQLISPPTYLGPDATPGCQIDITVNVSGSAATGSFHVWNANFGPAGDVYSTTTLPVGTYNNNLVTLGGNAPEFYVHKVWFEYNGVTSNVLENLICPGLTPAP